jgi:hypothetical protein
MRREAVSSDGMSVPMDRRLRLGWAQVVVVALALFIGG